jgi:hypothetical protein
MTSPLYTKLTTDPNASLKTDTDFVALWKQLALDTARLDRALTAELGLASCRVLFPNKKTPDFFPTKVEVLPSPKAVYQKLKALGESDLSFAWYGAFGERWLGYYDFLRNTDPSKLQVSREAADTMINWGLNSHYMAVSPKTQTMFVSERAVEYHVDSRDFLHNPNGPAILYEDGTALWAIHNTRVPKELIMTPADKLDVKLILTERNAQVRSEIIRKIGIQRVVRDLGAKTVDSSDDLGYKLLEIDLGNNTKRRYLQMTNPSVEGMIHVEAVPPTVKTVEEANAWRDNLTTYYKPEVLT